jgi:hypothetical protein
MKRQMKRQTLAEITAPPQIRLSEATPDMATYQQQQQQQQHRQQQYSHP